MPDDPYLTLGLPRDASKSDIHRAFRKLAKKYHPDLNHGDKTNEEVFKRLTAAYDKLTGKEPMEPELAPPPNYDHQYVSELESRYRAQRARKQKPPDGVLGNLSSFFKSRFRG